MLTNGKFVSLDSFGQCVLTLVSFSPGLAALDLGTPIMWLLIGEAGTRGNRPCSESCRVLCIISIGNPVFFNSQQPFELVVNIASEPDMKEVI